MVFTSVVLGLFHTMPYSWFSQKCSLSVQLFSQTIYMYVTCSFGIFDTNGLQLDFTSTKCSVGIVDTTAYSWCTESWVWGSEALPLAGMFGGLVRVKKVRSREFCRVDTYHFTLKCWGPYWRHFPCCCLCMPEVPVTPSTFRHTSGKCSVPCRGDRAWCHRSAPLQQSVQASSSYVTPHTA